MTIHRRELLFLLLVLLLCLGAGCAGGDDGRIRDLEPTVILVSIDGMRADYPEKTALPHLQRLIAGGTRAELAPVFPTKTFPSHYTLVTGLYAENHGVVGNVMYDPVFDETFTFRDEKAVSDGKWWGGEPIWVTAIKQGKRSAANFWPGSEAEIAGHRPTYYLRFDGKLPPEQRVATLLERLDLPRDERPVFFTLYFEHVDSAGHTHGPDSPELVEALHRVDDALGELLAGLEARGVLDEVNLIVTSDHGMAATPPEKAIFVDDVLDPADAHVIEYGPLLQVRSRSGRQEQIYRALARLAEEQKSFRVYRKAETPERWRYREHRRVAPVLAIADEGYTFTTREYFTANRERLAKGGHGFDNELPTMRAFFVAHGPAFRQNARAGRVEAVHLYELMCHLLGLRPGKNDGSLEAVRGLLRARVRPR